MSALTRLFVSSFHQRAIDEVNNLSSPVRNPRNSHNKSILRLVSTAAEMLLLEARQLSTQSTSCLPSDVPSHCCFKGRQIFCLFCKKNAPCLSIWKFWFFTTSQIYFNQTIFVNLKSPYVNIFWIYPEGFSEQERHCALWGLTAGPRSRSWLAPGLGPVCNVNISSEGDTTQLSTPADRDLVHQADYIGSRRIFFLIFCPREQVFLPIIMCVIPSNMQWNAMHKNLE